VRKFDLPTPADNHYQIAATVKFVCTVTDWL